MVALVFTLGSLNLALGFALAVALDRPWNLNLGRFGKLVPARLLSWCLWLIAWAKSRLSRRSPQVSELTAESPLSAPTLPQENPSTLSPPAPTPITLPISWRERLDGEGTPTESPWLGAILYLLFEGSAYIRRLAKYDRAHRRRKNDSGHSLADIRALNERWITCLGDGTQYLDPNPLHPGCPTGISQRLLDEIARLELVDISLGTLDPSEHSGVSLRSFRDVAKLATHAHRLIGFLEDSLRNVLTRTDPDQAKIHDVVSRDRDTGLANRLGLDQVLQEWRDREDAKTAPVSVVGLEVSHCHKWNEKLGLSVTSGILSHMGTLAATLVRRDRGFDRVIRVDGHRLLFFLGFTNTKEAASCAERVRQTLEATTFVADETEVTISANLAILGFGSQETAEALGARIDDGLKASRALGGNRTVTLDEDGPKMVDIIPYAVKSRTIEIACD